MVYSLGILLLLSLSSFAQERAPYRTTGRDNREEVLVEVFRTVSPFRWRASLVANSCTRISRAQCTLTVNRQYRYIIHAYIPYPGGLEEINRRSFIVDRFTQSSWRTRGYELPLDDSGPRDTLACDNIRWLPLGGGEKYFFAWTFQGEFENSMFRNEADTLQYTLTARGVHLSPSEDGLTHTVAHMESVGLPYTQSSGGGGVLGQLSRSDSMEFIFRPSQFGGHPRSLGEAGPFCAVEFSLENLPMEGIIAPRRLPLERAHPLFVDDNDVHQLLYPGLFRNIYR